MVLCNGYGATVLHASMYGVIPGPYQLLEYFMFNLLAELDAQLAMRKIAGSNYIIRVSISE